MPLIILKFGLLTTSDNSIWFKRQLCLMLPHTSIERAHLVDYEYYSGSLIQVFQFVDLLFSTPQPEGPQFLSLALKITVIADTNK